MQVELNNSIEQIAGDLPSNLSKDCGLLSGDSGAALFYAYSYHQFHKKEHLDTCIEIIEDLFDDVSRKFHRGDFSLANGMCGFLWLLHHLINLRILSDDNGCSEQLDSYIEISIEEDAQNGLYDLLYKMIGKGIYFLEKQEDENSVRTLRRIVHHLNNMKHETNEGVCWYDALGKNINKLDDKVQSLGLAHGVPSIIVFLSKVFEKGIEKAKTTELVTKGINWLLTKQLKNAHGYFANRADISVPSRLAWCYGDLGVATSLFQAGKIFNNSTWLDHACRIAKKAADRNFDNANLNTHFSGYYDACFCHGTVGIAHMFKRFYGATNDHVFYDRYQYWLRYTLELKKFQVGGVAGYLRFASDPNQEKKLILTKDIGLLNGVSGIGLGLISLASDENFYWDRFFLTDIPAL